MRSTQDQANWIGEPRRLQLSIRAAIGSPPWWIPVLTTASDIAGRPWVTAAVWAVIGIRTLVHVLVFPAPSAEDQPEGSRR